MRFIADPSNDGVEKKHWALRRMHLVQRSAPSSTVHLALTLRHFTQATRARGTFSFGRGGGEVLDMAQMSLPVCLLPAAKPGVPLPMYNVCISYIITVRLESSM